MDLTNEQHWGCLSREMKHIGKTPIHRKLNLKCIEPRLSFIVSDGLYRQVESLVEIKVCSRIQ